MSRLKRIAGQLAAGVGIWLAVAAVAAVTLEVWPRTLIGWISLVVGGPALYLAAEVLGEGFLAVLGRVPMIQGINRSVSLRTAGRAFSWLRIGVLLLGITLFLASVALVTWGGGVLVGRSLPAGEVLRSIRGFLEANFH